MSAKMRAAAKAYPKMILGALFVETEIRTTTAKERTPVWVRPAGQNPRRSDPIPGLLRASVHTEGPFEESGRMYANIVAGGAAGAYAARQHEELDWHHTIGQAKYIESVILESQSTLMPDIAKRIQLGDLKV